MPRFRIASVLMLSLALGACSLGPASQPGPTAPAATSAAALPTAPAPTEAARPTAPAATSAPDTQASYAPAPCEFEVPDDLEVACGFLTVPEDRDENDGRTVRLHVAVFKSESSNPQPDPIVYLEGGPGGNALEIVPLIFNSRFRPFLAERDFIMFDQRGTGYSEPALDCPELRELAFDNLGADVRIAEQARRDLQATLACQQRLATEGVDLAAYTSAANAADLDDLRVALGYDEWNLYGISYGTRLALTALRDTPDGIRSAILDSSYPPQTNLFLDVPASADRAFQTLFAGCSSDPACASAIPSLEQSFYDLVDKLNASPATLELTDPFSGDERQVVLNGDKLFGILFSSLYSTETIPLLPRAIDAALNNDDYTFLAQQALFDAIETDFVSYGMYYSVQCGEELPFTSRDELAAADQSFPEQRDAFDTAAFAEICAAWGAAEPPPLENEPVTSDIPTLVLSGQYDPITPPDYNRTVARTLSDSFFFEFPGIGHGVSLSGECPLAITLEFLDNPTSQPDASCIDELGGPAFLIPGAPVALEPIEDASGFSSVVPEDWDEISPGTYARSTGDVGIVQAALPGDQATVLAQLTSRFGLDEQPERVGERSTDQLNWTLYEFTTVGQQADLALAEGPDRTYVVILISTASERDALYDQVFLAALDAFAPLN